METVTIVKVKVKMTEDKAKLCTDIAADKYSKAKGELEVDKKVSPAKDCWRLVHDGTNVLHLFESSGVTQTVKNLICGTLEECQGEIERLQLKIKSVGTDDGKGR